MVISGQFLQPQAFSKMYFTIVVCARGSSENSFDPITDTSALWQPGKRRHLRVHLQTSLFHLVAQTPIYSAAELRTTNHTIVSDNVHIMLPTYVVCQSFCRLLRIH